MSDTIKYLGEIFGDIGGERLTIEASRGYGDIVSLTIKASALTVTMNLYPEDASELARHLTAAKEALSHV